jgi:branched-chain amino acid transport system ATP-binding protein
MPCHLELKEVVSGYGPTEVLHGVSLRVRPGEIVTLLGANGAGKTTTLQTVCGVVRARGGAIGLEGAEISRRSVQQIVAMGVVQVPEGRKLFPEMTVLENLEMGAYLRRDAAAVRGDLKHVMELFPVLGDRRRQLAGSLSGGEQQMLAIGRGLMARPKLLLLDEPSLGLAPILVEKIFEVVSRIRSEGVSVLLVEQNAHLALQLADRGYVMELGRVVLEGTGASLLENEAVKRAYLGA